MAAAAEPMSQDQLQQYLNHINGLLDRVDATRASLPLILRSLAPNKESLAMLQHSTSSAAAQDRMTQLVSAVQTGQGSIQQLRRELDDSKEVMNKVNASWRANKENVQIEQNRQKNQHFLLGLVAPTSAMRKRPTRRQPFASTSAPAVPADLSNESSCQDYIRALGLDDRIRMHRHKSTEDPVVLVTVSAVLSASIHVDQNHQSPRSVLCHALSEEPSMFRPSLFKLFDLISTECQKLLLLHPSTASSSEDRNALWAALLSTLASYSSLFSDPCCQCKRMLRCEQPPALRVYASPLDESPEAPPRFLAYHTDCWESNACL